MRKFKQRLNQLLIDNPNGMDFMCSKEFQKHAERMFYKHKGFDIVCSSKVPKGGIYFINYELTPVNE